MRHSLLSTRSLLLHIRDRQTDRQTNKMTKKQTERPRNARIDGQKRKKSERERETDGQTDRRKGTIGRGGGERGAERDRPAHRRVEHALEDSLHNVMASVFLLPLLSEKQNVRVPQTHRQNDSAPLQTLHYARHQTALALLLNRILVPRIKGTCYTLVYPAPDDFEGFTGHGFFLNHSMMPLLKGR